MKVRFFFYRQKYPIRLNAGPIPLDWLLNTPEKKAFRTLYYGFVKIVLPNSMKKISRWTILKPTCQKFLMNTTETKKSVLVQTAAKSCNRPKKFNLKTNQIGRAHV